MDLLCSAKDCRAPATWTLLWNNPKLHDPDRRKSWLACDDHREQLSDFLAARSFLRDVEPLQESAGDSGQHPPDQPDEDSRTTGDDATS